MVEGCSGYSVIFGAVGKSVENLIEEVRISEIASETHSLPGFPFKAEIFHHLANSLLGYESIDKFLAGLVRGDSERHDGPQTLDHSICEFWRPSVNDRNNEPDVRKIQKTTCSSRRLLKCFRLYS